MYKFENPVSIKVRSGDTGEVLYSHDTENAISDDVLCGYGSVFITTLGSGSGPACFLLPDGSNWSGFTYDRANPWAPYCITANNAFDGSAQSQWQYKTTYTPPSNPVTGQHKLFFEWTNLPTNLQLKAIGLTGWQSNASGGNLNPNLFGVVNSQATVFVPQTLVVLPTSILIHGRNGGSTTPDVLEISYFLSIVGAS
jgi:hypothetical protein